MFKNKAILLMASAVLAMPGLVQAQGVTPTAGGKGGTVAGEQIIARYASLAGGEANAKSLVNGLRNGSNITLSWDHRAFDGAYAANFLLRIKTVLETRDWEAEL